MDAIVHLHRGAADAALAALTIAPDDPSLRSCATQSIWRSMYAAVWADASFAAGSADITERLARAAHVARDNQVASAIIQRVVALGNGDAAKLERLAASFDDMDCPYQAKRTCRTS